MERLRQRLTTHIIGLTVFAACAFAQSTLTQIEDTVYTPSNTLFNGTVVITWMGSGTPSSGGPAPSNTSVQIYNGALSVLLVPSTTVTPPAYYQAVYNSSDGLVSWTETWQVPPSATPLTLSQVRVPNGSVSSGSGGSGSTTSIPISQVTGLSSSLNALNASITSLTNLVNSVSTTVGSLTASLANVAAQVNGLTSGSTTAVFVDDETPGGATNGTNGSFTLANSPSTAASLKLFKNGVLLALNTDYTLSGNAITFSSNELPQSGDSLVAYYRLSGTGPSATFVDDESPQGTSNGTNLQFTLMAAPTPPLSLKLFKNGALLEQSVDYTLSGNQITFTSQSVTPQSGDSLSAYYRITTQTAQPEGIFLNLGVTAPARPGH